MMHIRGVARVSSVPTFSGVAPLHVTGRPLPFADTDRLTRQAMPNTVDDLIQVVDQFEEVGRNRHQTLAPHRAIALAANSQGQTVVVFDKDAQQYLALAYEALAKEPGTSTPDFGLIKALAGGFQSLYQGALTGVPDRLREVAVHFPIPKPVSQAAFETLLEAEPLVEPAVELTGIGGAPDHP
ncbi:MAG: hypothetical protein R2857_05610 [Vampirovibrionales bacterium]